MFEFFSVDMIINILIGLLSAVVFIYCFVSLKRTSKTDGMGYLSNFSLAFLFYFLSNVSGYLSVGVAFLMGEAAGSEYFDLYVSLPGYIFAITALMYFVIGVKKSKLLRSA